MKKRAIAFFSTLLLLSLTSVLVTLSIKDSSEIHQRIRQDRMLVQENILLWDSVLFVRKKVFDRINALNPQEKESRLRSFLGVPIEIQNQLNNSSLSITLQNDEGKININEIIKGQTTSTFFENFFDVLGIVDKDLFTDLFIANIKTDNDELSNLDLRNDILNFTKGPIENFSRFNQLIAKYYEMTEDSSVNQVNWPTLIRFEGTGFNINYAPEEIVMALPADSLTIKQKQQIAKHTKLYHTRDELYEGIEITPENEVQINGDKDNLKKIGLNFTTKTLQTILTMDLISYQVEYRFSININNGKPTHISMLK